MQGLHASKWKVLCGRWYETLDINLLSCTLNNVLAYLQSQLEASLSGSTLKMYVVVLSPYQGQTDDFSLGVPKLVRTFLKDVECLHLPGKAMVPQWDLELVLDSLCNLPSEPIENMNIKHRSLKTSFFSGHHYSQASQWIVFTIDQQTVPKLSSNSIPGTNQPF